MSQRTPRPGYRLEPLARLREAQRESARDAASRARSVVEARRGDCAELERRIEAAQQSMREAVRQGAPIRPEEQLRQREYLRRLLAERAQRARALEAAEQAQVRVLETLRGARQLARTLELHRGRLEREHASRRGRAAAAQADEQWLITKRRR